MDKSMPVLPGFAPNVPPPPGWFPPPQIPEEMSEMPQFAFPPGFPGTEANRGKIPPPFLSHPGFSEPSGEKPPPPYPFPFPPPGERDDERLKVPPFPFPYPLPGYPATKRGKGGEQRPPFPFLPPPGYPTTKRPSAGQTRNPFLPPPGYFSKEDQEMFAFLHFSNLMLENKQSVNPFLPPPPRECPQVCDLRAHPDCSCLHPAAFTKDGRGNCNVGSLKPDLQVWCYVDPDKGDPTVVCPDARKSSSKKGYYWSRFACITE